MVDIDSPWTRVKMGLFLNVYIFLGVFCVIVLGSMPLKILIGRERPAKINSVTRAKDMRSHEEGTKSMPSGDATLGSFFCCSYAFIMEQHWIPMLCVPLICLARVYMHCHWFGDVTVGAIFGTSFSYVANSLYF